MTTTNETKADRIQQIAERAIQLQSMTSHGRACHMACQEFGVPAGELPAISSLVSQLVTEIQTFGLAGVKARLERLAGESA